MGALLPTWLVDALDRALPEMRGRERDELAEVILEAIPKQLVADVIRESATSVLITRGFIDDQFRRELAFEIGNNAGCSVVLSLQVGEDELDCVVPEASSPR